MPGTLKLAVSRHWLFRLAGALWFAVGLGLASAGVSWLAPLPLVEALRLAFLGLFLAWGMHLALFRRIRDRNIERIQGLPESVCLFAFQAWRSWLLVLVMMLLGVLLRHSPLPREILAVLYLMMGGALALSSFRYFTQ
ncbi:MAG: hypothetical protein HY924_08695 [Elusimicrobia bacterium]|nr:hypothetical protein [Elusimicrobiota bacterium]